MFWLTYICIINLNSVGHFFLWRCVWNNFTYSTRSNAFYYPLWLVIVYTPLIEIYNSKYVVYKPDILLLLSKNWTLLAEKVNTVIKSWTFFSKGLSFIGWLLVVNSLCASKLWYIISVLQPPQNHISSLQKVFIDFVCKVVIGLKVIYYIYVNRKAVWV